MKTHRLLLSAALAAGFVGTAARPASADMFENKAKQLAAELITNPSQFIFDFQKDMESTNPLPPGKWLGLNWHAFQDLLLPVPLLFTPIPDPASINLSGKLRLHAEGKLMEGLPQVDAIGGYWTLGPLFDALDVVDKNATATDPDTKLTKAEAFGYYYGAVVTTSLEPRVRLFGGYKFSQMKTDITLNKPQDLLGSQVSSFQTGFRDHFIFAGLEHPTKLNRLWNVQMFYGLQTNDFGAKVSWYRKYVELSLNIYPESVFVIHPVLNFHFNFG